MMAAKSPDSISQPDKKRNNAAKTKNPTSSGGKVAKRAPEPELESDVDPDLKAELEALVRECAAANPEAELDGTDIVYAAINAKLGTKPVKRQPLRGAVSVAAAAENMQLSSSSQIKKECKESATSRITSSSTNSSNSGISSGGGSKSNGNGSWNFEVDYNDHFETPLVAYTDILPMLHALALSLGKSPTELIIYDPYYCQGGMVQMLKEMGFPKVRSPLYSALSISACIPRLYTRIFNNLRHHFHKFCYYFSEKLIILIQVVNRNRDFYADITMKGIPNYDILVTNPPYSGEHKPKLLEYLLTSHPNSHCKPSSVRSEAVSHRYHMGILCAVLYTVE